MRTNLKIDTRTKGLCIQYEYGKFIKLNEKYYYEKELQKGIDDALCVTEFDNESLIMAVNYFRKYVNSSVIVKLIIKHIEDFKDKNKADQILKQETLRYFPKVEEKDFKKYNFDLGEFADTYIKRLIRQDIINAYEKIKSYSDFVFNSI